MQERLLALELHCLLPAGVSGPSQSTGLEMVMEMPEEDLAPMPEEDLMVD